jgi:branched-chain amino acid transport system permease protein
MKGASSAPGRPAICAPTTRSRARSSATDVAALAAHVVTGLATGGIYALLALGLVLVHRSTGVLNFAQGEMATLAAFVCWTLTVHGWAFWPAFGATVLLSFGGGFALHAVVIRPIERGPVLGVVLLTVGLLLAINGLDSWIWGGAAKHVHEPFSTAAVHVAGAALPKQALGVAGVALAVALALGALLTRTKLGLGLRAAAASPAEARLVGVPVAALVASGWGLAAATGAVAGVLASPSFALEPNMMQTVVFYAFAAALLGGMRSPLGAVVGGFTLGVALELLGAYVGWVDGVLRLPAALTLVLVLLLARPERALGRLGWSG